MIDHQGQPRQDKFLLLFSFQDLITESFKFCPTTPTQPVEVECKQLLDHVNEVFDGGVSLRRLTLAINDVFGSDVCKARRRGYV